MKTLAGLIIIGFVLTGCGGKVDEASQAMKNLETMAESAKDVESTQNVIDKRREERRAKGDTIAMPTDQLKGYLPNDIAGYKAGEPETSSTEMQGMSFAQATRTYTREDGSTIRVQLTDYNGSALGYAGMAFVFSLKMRNDNAQETSGTFQTGNPMINGFEKFDKVSKNSTLTYGLGGRFILNIDAEKQDIAFAHSVGEKVDLNKLAGM